MQTTRSIALALVSLSTSTLAQTTLQHIEVPGTSYLGWGLAAAGDVDADGHDDVLAIDLGSGAHVFSGRTGAPLHFVPGSFADARGAGDVNGDGHADFLLCWPSLSHVWVYSGADGSTIRPHPIPGAQAVEQVGDLDGDGHGDYVVGSGTTDELHVFSGIDGSTIRVLHGVGSLKVRNVGDVDLDGFDDVATIDEVGDVYTEVWSVATGERLDRLPDWFGYGGDVEIAAAGDVDGDGYPDVMHASAGQGWVKVYSGFDGERLLRLRAQPGQFYFGTAVCRAGDVDRDGHGDLAVRTSREGLAVYSGADGHEIYFYASVSYYGWTLAMIGDADGDGFEDFASGNEQGGTLLGNGPGFVEIVSSCPLPLQYYCESAPNSVGAGARMRSAGMPSLAANDFELAVTGTPPGEAGVFFYGRGRQEVPFGDGTLCVDGNGLGLFRAGPIGPSDASGTRREPLALTAGPGNPHLGDVVVGSRWHFQYWYRDPAGPGGSGFNLSDAFTLTLCP